MAVDAELRAEPLEPLPSAIDRGLRLIDGGELPKKRASDAEVIGEFRAKIAIIRDAIEDQAAKVASIADDLSVAHAERLRPRHEEHLRRVYEAAVEFSRALEIERGFRRDLVGCGYHWVPSQMPTPNLPLASRIGAETDFSSELSTWRRFSENRGLI